MNKKNNGKKQKKTPMFATSLHFGLREAFHVQSLHRRGGSLLEASKVLDGGDFLKGYEVMFESRNLWVLLELKTFYIKNEIF